MAIAVKGTIKRVGITTTDNGLTMDLTVTYITDLGGEVTEVQAAPVHVGGPILVPGAFDGYFANAIDDYTATSGVYTTTLT
jgi:hypothetical protein